MDIYNQMVAKLKEYDIEVVFASGVLGFLPEDFLLILKCSPETYSKVIEDKEPILKLVFKNYRSHICRTF